MRPGLDGGREARRVRKRRPQVRDELVVADRRVADARELVVADRRVTDARDKFNEQSASQTRTIGVTVFMRSFASSLVRPCIVTRCLTIEDFSAAGCTCLH